MRIARPMKTAVVVAVSAAGLVLSGCSGGLLVELSPGDEPTEQRPPQSDNSTESSVEKESADSVSNSTSVGKASWAAPVTTPGEKITTIEVGDITVDVHQVGTTKATKSGSWADPKTNEPIISPGDDIVFVNYVVTNNGAPVDLGSLLVSVDARYEDWPYMQGMDSVTDLDLFEQQDVNDHAIDAKGYQESNIYTLGSGEQFSFGENFPYQANSPIGFKAKFIPVDSQGELLHDDKVEAEGSGTIK